MFNKYEQGITYESIDVSLFRAKILFHEVKEIKNMGTNKRNSLIEAVTCGNIVLYCL